MKLTDGERLIAVMLAEVMEALKLNRDVDPSLIKTLVCNGDDWAIKRKYHGIFGSDGPTPEEVSETTDILWMWGIVEDSIAKLTGADAEEAKGWHRIKFGGFDANHDPHYGIAHTMINELDEFSSFKNRALDSHSQASLKRYRTMYATFDEYVRSNQAAPLTFESLRELCS